MHQYKGIGFSTEDKFVITDGLKKYVSSEIKIIKKEFSSEDYFEILKYIIDYVFESHPVISDNETIAYYSWILKFIKSSGDYELWEATSNGDDFQSGVDYALKITRDQKQICNQQGVSPTFPSFSQRIVISKGVYEGLEAEAVRYPSPNNMSGWWITTDLYDNNIESLMNVHFYHVAFQRPDLLKFLALPYGFRFMQKKSQQTDVWFDVEILSEEIE